MYLNHIKRKTIFQKNIIMNHSCKKKSIRIFNLNKQILLSIHLSLIQKLE